jgi:hypothetical protein
MLQGALTFLKYFNCFIFIVVVAVCVSFPTLQPLTHSVSGFTSGQASEVDLCSVHVITPNQRGEASQRWFTLHLNSFGTDEHNSKPVTNYFAMKQEEKAPGRNHEFHYQANSYVVHIKTALFLATTNWVPCHFLFRINYIITKYLIAYIGKLPLQYMTLI